MLKKEIQLPGREALRRLTAAQLVRVASHYDARIMIEHRSKVVNAKSMLGLLSLGAIADEPMYLVADGQDEERAVEAIVALLENNFEQTSL